MELRSFTKQVLDSAQETLNHEIDAPESESHKLLHHLMESVTKKIIKVSCGVFATFFLVIGAIFALNSWYGTPLWAGSWGACAVGMILFFSIRWN